MIKAMVIDDENLARSLIVDYLKDISFIDCVGSYANPLQAMEAIQDERVDLIFLDIQMPKLSGLDLLAQLPAHPFIVFTTAFAEHALKGYDFNTVDYLVKPVSFERFLKACLKVRRLIAQLPTTTNTQNVITTIPDGSRNLRIKPEDLYYVASNGDYLELHLANGNQHIRMSLRKLLEFDLPLARIHKSFAINPLHIEVLNSRSVVVNGDEIPIGRSFKDVLNSHDPTRA